jgi:hypothetical protein
LGTDPAKTDDDKTDDKTKVAKPGFWQATLPGGTYLTSVDKITSVSRQKYLLDGAFVVDEVTVDTLGQSLARFYFITPVGTDTAAASTTGAVLDRGKAMLNIAGQRTGLDFESMVVKKYPETTHARTIEYRLQTEIQLKGLFDSASKAWQSGNGGQFTVQLPK